MLVKLAFGNMRKMMHDYAVYFLTLALGVAVFYAFNTVSVQADFLQGDAARLLKSLGDMLKGLTVFLAFIMGFLMVYANNFLMRRRKKELGLYQVLGMRTGQVNAILALETLMVALVSFGIGLLVGSLFSQILLFVTASMFAAQIDRFHFFFSADAFALTTACFAVTFAVMMLFNTVTLSRVRLIDLMSSKGQHERQHIRNLPVSLVLTLAGAALVGCAYWRLTTQGFPASVTGSGTTTSTDFEVTTNMVIAGTYVFFYGFAGFLTMLLTHLKQFFWSDLHMFTTSEFASRIYTAAISMGTISLILFLAMTAVTTGMSLCTTLNAAIEQSIPYSASIFIGSSESDTGPLLEEALERSGIDLASLGSSAAISRGTMVASDGMAPSTMSDIAALTGEPIPAGFEGELAYEAIGISDYNKIRRLQGLEPVNLEDGHYLYLCNMEQIVPFVNRGLSKGYSVKAGSTLLTPERSSAIDDGSCVLYDSTMGKTPGTFVVPDASLEEMGHLRKTYGTVVDIRYSVPVSEGDAQMEKLQDALIEVTPSNESSVYFDVRTATSLKGEGVTMTGLVSYLAIYIGFILVIASAAILAIQQLSAASDAALRYRTLSELGCPEKLIRRSLRTQIVFAFLLPLVLGMAHSFCALVQVDKIVALFGYSNMWQSMLLGIGIFAVVYGGYLVLTYRMAYGVLRGALRTARHAL